MSFKKQHQYGSKLVEQAIDLVPGFKESYAVFLEQNTIRQSSKSML